MTVLSALGNGALVGLSNIQTIQTKGSQHAETTDHSIHPQDTQILEPGVKRLFLDSWNLTLDSTTISEEKPLPCSYLLFI